jgi:hypothetical protein
MSNTRIVIALSTAVVIGTFVGGSPSEASDRDSQSGGFVVPGSLDGVNPVYHPGIFRYPSVARAYGFVPLASRKPHAKPQLASEVAGVERFGAGV